MSQIKELAAVTGLFLLLLLVLGAVAWGVRWAWTHTPVNNALRKRIDELLDEASKRGIPVHDIHTIADLEAIIALYDETAARCRLCAVKVTRAEPSIAIPTLVPTVHTADDVVCGVVRPMCELCEGIVRGYRHGLVSEGRAAEQIGVNRLQLRYIADANLCGEEPN